MEPRSYIEALGDELVGKEDEWTNWASLNPHWLSCSQAEGYGRNLRVEYKSIGECSVFQTLIGSYLVWYTMELASSNDWHCRAPSTKPIFVHCPIHFYRKTVHQNGRRFYELRHDFHTKWRNWKRSIRNIEVSVNQRLICARLYGHAFGTFHFCPHDREVRISGSPE